MNKTGGHCAKGNKPDKEKKILYDLTYMWNFLKSQTHGDRVEWWLPGAIGWVREI